MSLPEVTGGGDILHQGEEDECMKTLQHNFLPQDQVPTNKQHTFQSTNKSFLLSKTNNPWRIRNSYHRSPLNWSDQLSRL